MSEIELREFYASKINEAETGFEKSMIQAERDHQLKMLEEGIDAKSQRDASQYECIGCGS